MGIIVHQLLIIGICIVIGTWVEGGRWAIAANGRLSFGAFAGTLAGFWTVVFAALMFWIGFVFWFHDLPRAANLSGAIVFGALYALAVAAVGIALGCWMGERERAVADHRRRLDPVAVSVGIRFPGRVHQPAAGLALPPASQHARHSGIHQAQPDGRDVAGSMAAGQQSASARNPLYRCGVVGRVAAGARTALQRRERLTGSQKTRAKICKTPSTRLSRIVLAWPWMTRVLMKSGQRWRMRHNLDEVRVRSSPAAIAEPAASAKTTAAQVFGPRSSIANAAPCICRDSQTAGAPHAICLTAAGRARDRA